LRLGVDKRAPAGCFRHGTFKDCADFSSQAEAQAYFEANAGSPTNNVDNLDADHDGQACEAFDYGGGGTGGGGTGGDDGDLPFTGPNDTLLPAGTALLLAGLALVGITRYRARHARR
jgi:Excalibur calcium-binding domain